MNNKEQKADINNEIKEMRAFVRILKNDKAKAREFLCEAGIYTPTGNLSRRYKR